MAGSDERKRFIYKFFTFLAQLAEWRNVYTSETNGENTGNNWNILPKNML